jgi:hypothetical protein
MADEGFASPTSIDWQGHTGVVQYGGGDRSMMVIFYNKAVHDQGQSRELGRPIYHDKVFARISPPGERLNIVDRPVRDSDKRRWPIQWAQFQQNKQQIPEGTPIGMLFPDQPSIAAMLTASNVHTIEQCADLSGDAIDNVGMGAQKYVNAAQKYLEIANKGVGIAQMRSELESRDRDIKVLTSAVENMKAEIDRLRADNSGGLSAEALQTLLAGAMRRPEFAAGAKAPPKPFDAASALINANHATADIARQRTRQRVRTGNG